MPNIVLAQPLPPPRCTMNVRPALVADAPFIDALQKMHSHMVGFLPLKQIEKRIADGEVLIAEEVASKRCQGVEGDERCQGVKVSRCQGSPPNLDASTPGHLDTSTPSPVTSTPSPVTDSIPVGYIIAKDQYMKRDDVGIVYQLNVLPLRHRHLVGATLVKAVFDRAAYGCKLFSCWCAQDIQANWFWESIGFVPLAFRTGSRAKQRIHIYWQKRIREGDEVTPYWFPSKTEGGAVGEDRIVLPIPEDTHWRDAKPLVLPGLPVAPQEMPALLPGGAPVRSRPEQPKLSKNQRAAIMRSQSKHLGGVPLGKMAVLRGGRIKYIDRPGYVADLDAPEELAVAAKPKKPRAPRQKNDPKHIAAARELRDRFLDQVNAGLILPGGSEAPVKYDVSRQLPAAPTKTMEQVPLLRAA